MKKHKSLAAPHRPLGLAACLQESSKRKTKANRTTDEGTNNNQKNMPKRGGAKRLLAAQHSFSQLYVTPPFFEHALSL